MMKLAYAHRSIMPYGNTNNRGLNFYDTSSDAKKSINVQTPKKILIIINSLQIRKPADYFYVPA